MAMRREIGARHEDVYSSVNWCQCALIIDVLGSADFYELPLDEEWEIDRSQITIKDQLGEGAFGLVMKAEAVGIADHPSVCSVAVKMLKGLKTIFYIMSTVNGLNLLHGC